MQKKNLNPGKTTQSFLKIAEIKNDCVVLNDGTMRAVLSVSSTNFDLKSQEEQDAIIFAFQRFLNSLEFPIQIIMQSRKMEVGNYLEKLKRIAEKQVNELLKVQTSEYVEFVSRLIENASIMNKNFYLVVPLSDNILPSPSSVLNKIFGGGKAQEIKERVENFEKAKEKLDNRVVAVNGSLGGLGLRTARLKTEELIQLYYNSYNFESAPVIDATKLQQMEIITNTEKK